MLNGVLSQPSKTTTNNSILNRRIVTLLAFGVGGASLFSYWMYRQEKKKRDKNKNKTITIKETGTVNLISSNEIKGNTEIPNEKAEEQNIMNIEEFPEEQNVPSTQEPSEEQDMASTEETHEEENNMIKEPVNPKKSDEIAEENTEIPNGKAEEHDMDSPKELVHVHELQSEFDWASLVDAEEIPKETIKQQHNKEECKMMTQTHQNDQASHNGDQHDRHYPVNSICTCPCCLEVLSDLQSSRGYKNAESPHSTHSEGSADSGRATGPLTSCSPFADELGHMEILPIYEFEVPNTLVGLIIGIKGKTIRELCMRANVRMLIRPHHTPNKYETHQICSVEGRREDINKCLHMIRLRFPPCRFPDLNLKPVLPPPPTTPATTNLRDAPPTALTLPVGVPCEVYISAHVDAGHFFCQLPTHPSFSSLTVLDQYMLSVYTQPGGAPDLPKPCNVGVLLAAPAYQGWFRAITLAYDQELDETLVRFVDYGGFARLPRADLRQIRTDFMTLPMQAIECYLANVQPIDGTSHWCEKANELFQQLCVSKIIQASLVGYCKHDGIPCVELYVLDENKKTIRIDQILLERGLAKRADPTILVRTPLVG